MAFFSRKEKTPLGIYVHVPFCRSKCQYCDFYSVTDKTDRLLEDYMDAVCDHIRETGDLCPDYKVDTIYFGGGTPSFFGADGMAAILTAIRRNFDVSGSAEITFEANPDSISPRLLRKLRGEGFNRVSLGVQCDNDAILERIGRPHNYEQAVNAVQKIRRAGFKNLSLDLIYGLPGQTLESWEKTLSHVLELKPEHISCYGLKVEEGTPLYLCKDYCNLPDDDAQADMYLSTVDILRAKGYRQYEISNFCKRGHESKHNLKYWTGGEYLGFGPDASSDFAGKRFKVIRDLRGYIDGIQNKGQVLEDIQTVPNRERAGEYLMMRLRTSLGVNAAEYEKKFLLPFTPLEKALEQCRERGHALRTDGGWRLTAEGFLLSNTIISDLLLIQENSKPLAKRR
ncbi:MAG: radical SAM family heme chaperone HemW [Ruminococcaceae bacterium]|nr:radical SAM family heme chaperone HemW [Oscillospiraceae bacterium]